MNQQFDRYLQFTLITLDFIILNLVFITTKIFFGDKISIDSSDTYFRFLAVANTAWLILTFFLRAYAGTTIHSFEVYIKRTIQIFLAWVIVILFYLFFLRELSISRLFVLSVTGGFAVGLTSNRFIYLGITRYFKTSKFFNRKILILGFNETAKKLTSYLEQDGLNTEILGYIEDDENIHELSHYPIVSNIRNALHTAKEMEAHEIFSTIPPEQNKNIYDLMHQSEQECIRFRVVPDLSLFISRDVYIEYYGDLPILSLRKEPLDDVGNRIKKRALDLTVSVLVTIFILSWLIPLIGLLILLDSGKPVFFNQQRTGKDKKPFNCIKFRSMKPNPEANSKQATRDDDRITRLGRFLRKTSLDEFPQFINVLRGEMSLVGPRPHMTKHTDDYSEVVDDYMIRQFIKPGITGWAQINGYRGEITNDEQIKMRVEKDIWYLENWTLWLDIKILFLTVYSILRGDEKAF